MAVEDCLETGVIEKTKNSEGEYIFNIFVRPKKDGSYRLILNLKHLNQFAEYHHFKMENLKSAIYLMSPNCYTATIDLKDAYYSVSVEKDNRKNLRFLWNNQLFQFTLPCLLTLKAFCSDLQNCHVKAWEVESFRFAAQHITYG